MNIEILKPDVNKSFTKFTVDNGKIRFGLGSIKNVGISVVDSIVSERNKNGKYKSFTDFCERVQEEAVNKKCIESLIKAGAFDEFGQTRSTLLASFEGIIDTIQNSAKRSFKGQVTMFDLTSMDSAEKEEMKYSFIELKEYEDKELLSMEKEMLGIYISGHPLEKIREQIIQATNINTMQMKEIKEELDSTGNTTKYKDGQNIKYAGIISSIKKKYTKSNKLMAFVSIEDLYGTAEIIVFESVYQNASNLLTTDNVVLVEGRLSIREDEDVKIVAREIKELKVEEKKILKINITNLSESKKAQLRGALKFFNGEYNNTQVQVIDGEQTLNCGTIYLTKDILQEFKELIGEEEVMYM